MPQLCLRPTPLPSASSASAPPRHLLNLLCSRLRLNSFSPRLCLGSASPRLHVGPSRPAAPRRLASLPRCLLPQRAMRDLVAATSTDVDEGPMVRATRARFARLLPMIALRAKSTCPLEAARLGLEELEWRRSIRVPSSLPFTCAPPPGRRALKIERLPQKPWLGGGKKKSYP